VRNIRLPDRYKKRKIEKTGLLNLKKAADEKKNNKPNPWLA
jgi:hypothetical protein